MEISSYIDHTLLKPTASFAEIERLCEEAIRYGFAAVCIPPPMLKLALQLTASSSVKKATVVGFPLGYACTASKLEEVELALADQADELDVVINLIDLKNGRWDLL